MLSEQMKESVDVTCQKGWLPPQNKDSKISLGVARWLNMGISFHFLLLKLSAMEGPTPWHKYLIAGNYKKLPTTELFFGKMVEIW